FPAESLCAPSALTTARTGPFSSITAVEAASFEDVYVVVQVPQDVAPGAGPVIASPVLVPLATTVTPPTTTLSKPLKFALRMVNCAAPVSTVMVPAVVLSVARFAPPTFPVPALVNVMPVFAAPAATVACVSTSTHLQDWSSHSTRQRNCPMVAPVRPRDETPEQLAGFALAQGMVPLANGTPAVTGSLVRATPVMPGYFISCMVKGTLSWAADREEKRTA